MNNIVGYLEWVIDQITSLFNRRTSHVIARFLGKLVYATLLREKWKVETELVQKSLLTSFKNAKEIALSGFLNTCSFFVDYQYFAITSPMALTKLVDTVHIEGENHLISGLQSERPLIITTIHMDSFLIGILKLSEYVSPKRKITIIKVNPPSKKEAAAYAQFVKKEVNFEILRVLEKPALETVKRLRQGQILVVMGDVDPDLSKTESVSFLGHQAKFPCGVIELAIASNSIILPMVMFKDPHSHDEKHIVKIEELMDPQLLENVSFKEKTVLLTQRLVGYLESWITYTPEQWQMWIVLKRWWAIS